RLVQPALQPLGVGHLEAAGGQRRIEEEGNRRARAETVDPLLGNPQEWPGLAESTVGRRDERWKLSQPWARQRQWGSSVGANSRIDPGHHATQVERLLTDEVDVVRTNAGPGIACDPGGRPQP